MNKIGKELFEAFSSEAGSQKLVDANSVLKVYYGMNDSGNLRLSFVSSIAPPKMDSTRLLKVMQGKETANIYWTNFDLLESTASQVFYSFCGDLVSAITGLESEKTALVHLKNRFHIWKSMFKKSGAAVSTELIKGLFGELYFLDTVLVDKYGADNAVNSWGGSDGVPKDFSIDSTWYEVKVVSPSAVSVKISSLSQLASEIVGHLIVIKLETMQPAFSNGKSSIGELFNSILVNIVLEETKEAFLNKILAYGINLSDECCSEKFNVLSVQPYLVGDSFPRLTDDDIKHNEICKVSYELIINSLSRFKEE
ncbi:MAG: PD-(D/E)XK motif protein [Defluviitaleaceae bacterium]|nr:PD-(D/E)XK motif protein [Defluviitaleaceae bacterium]